VRAGSALGIVGKNGAGKSTLLRIISGATSTSSGRVLIEGRVAAILELGMGFHPEFTGRQNVVMAGQLIGLGLNEVESVMSEIETFASIGDFFDQPLRTYSTGMQMRLAFSLATAVRPAVLIIDEALAVGDAAFQRKCFRRIEEFRQQGTALLFVSHDIGAVRRLCDTAIFLSDGCVVAYGHTREVCDAYERALFGGSPTAEDSTGEQNPERTSQPAQFDASLVSECEQFYGTGEIKIESCWLESTAGHQINVVRAGDRIRWCFHIFVNEPVESPIFSMMLKTREGEAVFGTDSSHLGLKSGPLALGQRHKIVFEIDTFLASGHYYLNCGVRVDDEEGSVFLSRRIDAAILRVTQSAETTVLVGISDLKSSLSIEEQKYG
tara:strand:- start:470 stop:1609 length:1140 start_codon:yes stop_codon:yes gene_type:complete